MSDLLFNHGGRTHSMRLRPVDVEPGEVAVFEALVDGATYVHFEAPEDAEVWDLFRLAVEAYVGYREDIDKQYIQQINERRP